MPPLLSFNRTFETSIDVGNRKIPIHVKRLSKAELEELDDAWGRLIVLPRGGASRPAADASPEDMRLWAVAESDRQAAWNKSVAKERFELFESTISRYITIDEGVIEDAGQPVTSGDGLIRIFHGCRDILRDLIGEVILQNHLVELTRKNLSSPQGSASGLVPSTPISAGGGPVATAASVGGKASAGHEAVTEKSDSTSEDAPASSGETEKVH